MATYSLLDVELSVSGPNISQTVTGLAEEGFTPSFEEDADVMTQGSQGDVMHSLTAAKRGTIEVHLLKTSPMNAAFSYAYNQDRANGSQNWARNTFVINNPVSGDYFVCKGCAFRRFPSDPYQMRGNILVWIFNVSEIDPQLGALTVQ